ncbi:MAG: hypothetical protein AABW64_01210 [Nanoarchaeota archaeon]
MAEQKVVICGSMRFLEKMKYWKEFLESKGYSVDTPTLIDFHKIRDKDNNIKEFEHVKRRETKNHFEKVKSADILLILNYDKDGKKNYIGGNTFAEISYAVALNLCHGRSIEIFTVNPLPEDAHFFEELSAWGIKQWDQYKFQT